MKKYTLHIKFGKDSRIDVDREKSVTDEEFQIFISAVQVLADKFFTNNNGRVVDKFFSNDFINYFCTEFNKLGKVEKYDFLSDIEVLLALWL